VLTRRPGSLAVAGDASALPAPRPPTSRPASARLSGWPALVAGSLALALVSALVLPQDIAYDPWSWLIWGREITHLNLSTSLAATAVKPLPIFVDTVLAPTGSLAPVLWLLIARAAALLAVGLTFRLGHRFGGVVAGLIAAVALAVDHQYVSYLFMAGMSEPMAAAGALAAVDCHVQGRPRAALVALAATGLLRPEAWPFLVLYCLWLAIPQSTARRAGLAAIAFGTPAVWFVIDKLGSGEFLRSAGAASVQSQGGPLLSREPGIATVRETWPLMRGPVLVLFVLGLAAALVAWRRTGRPGPMVWLGLGAVAWLVVDAILAQGGFATGAPRYLLPGVGLACVVVGVFVADTLRALAALKVNHRLAMALATAGAAAVTLSLVPLVVSTSKDVHGSTTLYDNTVHSANALSHAITAAGGRQAVNECGPFVTRDLQATVVAWQLHSTLARVRITPVAAGTVLQQNGYPKMPAGLASLYHVIGSADTDGIHWTILATC
jgi:hypothetical protein